MNKQINVDKLHYMIENEHMWKQLCRQSGRTFTMLVQAVQSSDLLRDEHCAILIVGMNRHHAYYLFSEFSEIARSYGVEFNTKRDFMGNCRVIFTTPSDIQKSIVGRRFANYFVDHTVTLSENQINFIKSNLRK